MFSLLSLNEKSIIFTNIDQATGAIESDELIDGSIMHVHIASSKDLVNYIELNHGDYSNFGFIADKYLFEKILFISHGNELEIVPASDNNIFD